MGADSSIPDELRLGEGDFTEERYRRAVEYFESELPEVLHDSASLAERVERAAFWISYRNNLTFLQGYVLRQRVSAAEAEKKNEAEAEFCEFVSRARWVD